MFEDGLNAPNASNTVNTNVKQEPVSDDECHSEDAYQFEGDHDPDEEEDAFAPSECKLIFVVFEHTLPTMSSLLINNLSGDFDGSDIDYDDDNNEYGNSETKGYGSQHWERKAQPDLTNVKEEKV